MFNSFNIYSVPRLYCCLHTFTTLKQEMSDDEYWNCEYCRDFRGMCDTPHLRDDRFFSMKLDENGDMYLPCHARRYVLERLGFEDHERIETRSANLRTIHGHTFVIKVFNSVFQTEFGCPNWEDLCKAYGFQKGMEITFDLRPEDNMPDNIDIWVVVDDMLPVLPPCEFLNHICQVICIYI